MGLIGYIYAKSATNSRFCLFLCSPYKGYNISSKIFSPLVLYAFFNHIYFCSPRNPETQAASGRHYGMFRIPCTSNQPQAHICPFQSSSTSCLRGRSRCTKFGDVWEFRRQYRYAGISFFRLSLLKSKSQAAPLGQSQSHQYLPLKNAMPIAAAMHIGSR